MAYGVIAVVLLLAVKTMNITLFTFFLTVGGNPNKTQLRHLLIFKKVIPICYSTALIKSKRYLIVIA